MGSAMAITTKRRRKIQLAGRTFIWWVAPDHDFADSLLHICSTDKRFLVHYPLGQSAERRHLIVLGPELPPLEDAGGPWIRLRTPSWDDNIVTPGLVRKILEWAQDPLKVVLRVD